MTPSIPLPPGAKLVQPQGANLPPGATLVSGTLPPERTFMDSMKDAGSAFWDWTGKPVADALGLSGGTDAERGAKARQAQDAIVKSLANEPARVRQEFTNSLDAFVAGNPRATLHHVLNAVPLVGAGIDQTAQDFAQGNYAKGVGHLFALISPAAAREAPAVVGAAREAAQPAIDAITQGTAATRAGIAAAGPDVAMGAAKVAGGEALAGMLPPAAGWPARVALAYPGARQVVAGMGKGVEAFKRARMGPPEVAPGFGVASGSSIEPPISGAPRPVGYQPPVAGSLPGAEMPPVPVVDPILDQMAQHSGFESFAAAPPEAQAFIKNMAANQPAPRPAMGPAPETPTASMVDQPVMDTRTAAEQLRDELAAQRQPEVAPPSPPIGAHVAAPPVNGRGTPIQPPLRQVEPPSAHGTRSVVSKAQPVTPEPVAPPAAPEAPAAQPETIPAPTSRVVEVPSKADPSITSKLMTEDGMRQYMADHSMGEEEARATLGNAGYEVMGRGQLNRAIHGLGGELGLDHAALSDIAGLNHGVKSMTQLSQDEMLQMFERLADKQSASQPLVPKLAVTPEQLDRMTIPQARQALGLNPAATEGELRSAILRLRR